LRADIESRGDRKRLAGIVELKPVFDLAEFAGRHTDGHFDLPMMGTTIELDGVAVVREGVLQDVFG
jgi:hypothetical protein